MWPPVAQAEQVGFRLHSGDARVFGSKVTRSLEPLDIASRRLGREKAHAAGRVPSQGDHWRISRSGISIGKKSLNTKHDCQEISQHSLDGGSPTIMSG